MRVALDTNRLTDLFQGDAELADRLSECDEVWIPLIVLAEIKAGFTAARSNTATKSFCGAFLAKPTVGVLLPARETAEHYAHLFVQLKRVGTPIPDNDIWIAALVLEHDLQLITRDQHFERVPQLLARSNRDDGDCILILGVIADRSCVPSAENWRSRLGHWTRQRGPPPARRQNPTAAHADHRRVGGAGGGGVHLRHRKSGRSHVPGGRRSVAARPDSHQRRAHHRLSAVAFFPNARGSGIPQTKAALFLRDGYISLRTVLGKFGCCSASLASGIALGREGPSVQVGAGIASVLGRRLGLGPSRIRELIPVGAAAALAAAFNTPVAAVLFTLEEVMGDLHAPVLGSIVLGSATSWVTLHLLLGDEPLFHVPSYQLVSPIEFITYALLGIAGGLVSVAFVKLLLGIRKYSAGMPRWTEWMQPAMGGLAVGLMGWFVPDVLGVGYGHVERSAERQMTLEVMALLVVLKLLATTSCYGPGNAGGIFGPALFIGAMLGGAVGTVAHQLLPDFTGGVGALCVSGHGRAICWHRARAADVGDHDLRDDARLFHHRAAHDREPDQLLHLVSLAKRADIRSPAASGWIASAVRTALPARAVDCRGRSRSAAAGAHQNRSRGRCARAVWIPIAMRGR